MAKPQMMTESDAISPDPTPNTQDLYPPGATGHSFPPHLLIPTISPLTPPLPPLSTSSNHLTIHTPIILTPFSHLPSPLNHSYLTLTPISLPSLHSFSPIHPHPHPSSPLTPIHPHPHSSSPPFFLTPFVPPCITHSISLHSPFLNKDVKRCLVWRRGLY